LTCEINLALHVLGKLLGKIVPVLRLARSWWLCICIDRKAIWRELGLRKVILCVSRLVLGICRNHVRRSLLIQIIKSWLLLLPMLLSLNISSICTLFCFLFLFLLELHFFLTSNFILLLDNYILPLFFRYFFNLKFLCNRFFFHFLFDYFLYKLTQLRFPFFLSLNLSFSSSLRKGHYLLHCELFWCLNYLWHLLLFFLSRLWWGSLLKLWLYEWYFLLLFYLYVLREVVLRSPELFV